jgi:hypothetical protein
VPRKLAFLAGVDAERRLAKDITVSRESMARRDRRIQQDANATSFRYRAATEILIRLQTRPPVASGLCLQRRINRILD